MTKICKLLLVFFCILLAIGAFIDFSNTIGTGEVVSFLFRKKLIDVKKVGGGTLENVYNQYSEKIEEKFPAGSFYASHLSPKTMIDQLRSLPEFQNASFFQDVNITQVGAQSYTVVQDTKKFNEELSRVNQISRLAKSYGNKSVDDLAAEGVFGGVTLERDGDPITVSFDEMKSKLEGLSRKDVREFKRASPEEQLNLLTKHLDMTRDDILKAEDPQKVMDTMLAVADTVEGFTVYTENVVEINLGVMFRE